MDEKLVKEILGQWIQEGNMLLDSVSVSEYIKIIWKPGMHVASLRGNFSYLQLEAISWWIKKYNV